MRPTTIDDYKAPFPAQIQKRLEEIRQLVHQVAPEAQEVISYAMPAFKANKRILVYFAAHEKHLGMYPLPKSGSDAFMQELEPYKAGKGTVRFYYDKPLPTAFIKQLVKNRLQDTLEKR